MKKIFILLTVLTCLFASAQKNGHPKAPKSLSYSTPNIFTVGTAVSLSRSVSGVVSAFSVSPALPSGISLNPTSGVISGTPTLIKPLATYTVTASNSYGSSAFGVVITVISAPISPPPPAPTTTTPTTGSTTGSTTTGSTTTASTTTSATTSVVYTVDAANFSNPERGFYKHTETHSTGYYPLSSSTLTGYRTNSNISLILRVFYLENFVNSSISSSYLASMQQDFANIRNAGLKCIVRFAYADHNDPGVPHDATKVMTLSHINQLTPILQANSDVISVMQAGFIGSWGEWYYTDNFGMSPTATDFANRKSIVDAVLAAVPNRMAQIRTPSLKMNTFNVTSPLSLTQAYSSANIARVGHHNDCFLASGSDYGTYSNASTEYPYLEQETKYLPMGGETCAVNAPRSECTTAVSEMKKFHWSYMNLDYNETVISGFQTNNCFTEMQTKLGYRFELVDGVYPSTAIVGAAMPVTIKVKNVGFATPYNARTAYIVYKNTATNAEFRVALNSNPRYWNANTTTTIVENIAMPSNMPAGSYSMFLALPDADASLAQRPEYAIRMANSNIWDAAKGYNSLSHTVNITAPAGRLGDLATKEGSLKSTIYPVPANNTLSIEMENIADYSVALYNSLGQKMVTDANIESDNRITLNTQDLKNGVYIINMTFGDKTETKRIIISH